MIFKSFNFNQQPRLVINGNEYTASNIISGVFHIYNKSQITLRDVWYKDERNRLEHSLKFPPFSLVEIYFGNDLAFFGINKLQKGGSLNPLVRKDLTMTIIDFKEWLTHKPMDFPIYNKDPDWVVKKVISTLNENRIISGDLKFGKTDKIKAYSTQTKNAYDVLRMIEKKTQSILQITPNSNGQLVINFYTKESVKVNKTGIELNLADESKAMKFYEDYQLTSFDWEENLNKFANMVRVQSEQALGETPISITFNLNGGETSYTLLKPVGRIIKDETRLYDDSNNELRKLNVVTKDAADKGKTFDIAYAINSNQLTISDGIAGKNQVVKLKYYPIVKVEYQMDNIASQKNIASYSGSNGILFRTEKHNDETSPSDLIALGQGYLAKNSEPRVSLRITSKKPIWDLGEHTTLTSYFEPSINGEYVVYLANIRQIVDNDGVLDTEINYELMSSLDFDEELNRNDSQAYRDNPIFEAEDVIFPTRTDIQEEIIVEVKNFTCAEKVINSANNFFGDFSNVEQEAEFMAITDTVLYGQFGNEDLLTRISLPNATTIEEFAFASSPLTYIDIRKATTIWDNAFLSVVNDPLTTVILNKKFDVDAEKDKIFGVGNWGSINFQWTNNDGTPWVEPNSFTGTFSTPAKQAEFMAITDTVADNQFNTETGLTSIKLPHVKTIGNSAFSASPLTSISLPVVEVIKPYAFTNAVISELSLPLATTINNNVFANAPLTSIKLPKATVIGNFALFSTVNQASTEVWLNHNLDNMASKNAIFGFGSWQNITFHWTNDDGTPYTGGA